MARKARWMWTALLLALVAGPAGPKSMIGVEHKWCYSFTADRGAIRAYFQDSTGVWRRMTYDREWMTASDKIRAYDLAFWAYDTTNHYYDARYVDLGLHKWVLDDVPTGVYRFMEIGGSPDSLISGMDSVMVWCNSLPDSIVSLASIPLGLVDGTRISAGSTITAYEVKTDRLNPKTTGARIEVTSGAAISADSVLAYADTAVAVPKARFDEIMSDELNPKTAGGRITVSTGSSIEVDSIFGYSGLQVFLPDGKLYVGSSTLTAEIMYSDGNGHWYTTKIDRDLGGNKSLRLPHAVGFNFTDTTAPTYRQSVYVKGAYTAWRGWAGVNYSGVFADLNVTFDTDSAYVESELPMDGMPCTLWAWEP